MKLYNTYMFTDKDPAIGRVRKLVEDSKLSYDRIATISGVAQSTLRNWFYGATKRPQHCTLAAVAAACGYKMQFVDTRRVTHKQKA